MNEYMPADKQDADGIPPEGDYIPGYDDGEWEPDNTEDE